MKTPIFIRGTWPPKLLGQVTADVRLLALYQLAAGTDLSTNMTAEELSLSLAAAYPYAQARNHVSDVEQFGPFRVEASVGTNGVHVWESVKMDRRRAVATLFPANNQADKRSEFEKFLQGQCLFDLKTKIEEILG